VLDQHIGIKDEADSILFGPEKNHVIPILESTQNSLTEESRVWVGNRGQPPKLKRYIPQIINAFRRNEERDRLPRSISGIWKADLFLGGRKIDRWLGTTVKINSTQLVGAQGLRVGIYPRVKKEVRGICATSTNAVANANSKSERSAISPSIKLARRPSVSARKWSSVVILLELSRKRRRY
jgi:hypothetical protein